PQPAPTSSADLDPYHAPQAFVPGATSGASPVTIESFFPVSAPHRARSAYLLRDDPQSGVHAPELTGLPQLFLLDAPLPTAGPSASNSPLMLPARAFAAVGSTKAYDPSDYKNPTEPDPTKRELGGQSPLNPGVRFSREDPEAHIDQNWTVTYEGPLPAFDGI